MPTYNVEKYFRQCIESVINQTLTDIEIIPVDDGSPDNCGKIMDEYAANDSRIKPIHKKNGGYGKAVNAGMAVATGEYIGIVETDDYIDSKMYEDLYKIAKNYDSDIVKSCFYDNLQSPQKTKIKKVNWCDYIPEDKSFTIKEYPYFLYYHPSIWSCIYKKEFLNKNNIKFVEAPGAGWTDNPFQVQTMCLAEKINYTSNAYYYWRRVNFNESDDLKDYTIPFKRTDEIHNWLKENNIEDENILIQLFRRELTYIAIVLGMKNISDKSDCYNKISKIIANCPKKFSEDKNIRKNEKSFYKSVKKNPHVVRFKIRTKILRRNIITIKLKANEKRVVILGKDLKLYFRNEKMSEGL